MHAAMDAHHDCVALAVGKLGLEPACSTAAPEGHLSLRSQGSADGATAAVVAFRGGHVHW